MIEFQASKHDKNKYVGSPYCRTEMYVDRIACCLLVSHVEYAPRTLSRFEKRWHRQKDGRMPDRYITHTARRGQLSK